MKFRGVSNLWKRSFICWCWFYYVWWRTIILWGKVTKKISKTAYQLEVCLELTGKKTETSHYKVSSKDGYANVRKGPSTNAPVLRKAENGEIIRIDGKTGDWKIEDYYENETWKKGYIHSSQLIEEK